jgi:exonuclease-1
VEICNGERSQTWINYCLSFLDVLLRNGVLVTMVFDGANLPMKALTENDRESNRQACLEKARELMRNGDKDAARNFFARAVDITPAMAAELIQIIKQTRPGVDCIVAPYEADAQLAYLSANNLVDCVVTEDSDTIPYGCKDILFKLERDGSCQRLVCNDLYTEAIDKFDLRGFTEEMILNMCILSGCDYLDSVKGMGLKTSYKHIVKHRNAANVLKSLRLAGQLPIVQAASSSENNPNAVNALTQLLQYELDFYQAILTFNHQVVFDPISRKSVHRTPLNRDSFPQQLLEIWWPDALEAPSLPFLGSLLSDEIAQGIADGLIDPVKKSRFQIEMKQQIPHKENANHAGFQQMPRTLYSQSYQAVEVRNRNHLYHNTRGISGNVHVLPSSQPKMARSATISTLAHHQYSQLSTSTVSAITASASSLANATVTMKSYFAASSIRRYESTSTTRSKLVTAPGITGIPSYFSAVAKPLTGSMPLQVQQVPSSSSTFNPNSTPVSNNLRQRFQRFANTATGNSTNSSETVVLSSHTAISSDLPNSSSNTRPEDFTTIDLSFEDSEGRCEEGTMSIASQEISTTTTSSCDTSEIMDIYDVPIITPEKLTLLHPNTNSSIVTATTIATHSTRSTEQFEEDFDHTPSSLLSGVDTPHSTTSSICASSVTKLSASKQGKASVIKAANGNRISKFFSQVSKPPLSTKASVKGGKSPTKQKKNENVGIASTLLSRVQEEEEQLADRLLVDIGVCGSNPASPMGSLSTAKERPSLLVIETIDMYDIESSLVEDEKQEPSELSSDSPDSCMNHFSSTSSSSELEKEPTTGKISSPLKRSSFAAFSSQESLSRLQKQRVTETQYQLTQRSATSPPNGEDEQHVELGDYGYEASITLSPPVPSGTAGRNLRSTQGKNLFAKFAFH